MAAMEQVSPLEQSQTASPAMLLCRLLTLLTLPANLGPLNGWQQAVRQPRHQNPWPPNVAQPDASRRTTQPTVYSILAVRPAFLGPLFLFVYENLLPAKCCLGLGSRQSTTKALRHSPCHPKRPAWPVPLPSAVSTFALVGRWGKSSATRVCQAGVTKPESLETTVSWRLVR